MTDEELTNELLSRNALVVHFSHHAKMREGGVFPNDMLDAIQHRSDWPLSCCVLWPGHTMQPPGSVGIIFKPTFSSVISVSNSDSGSSVASDGSDYSAGVPLTMHSLNDTFNVYGSYNEWRLKGADATGIFVVNTTDLYAKKEITIQTDEEPITEIAFEPLMIDEVFAAFPKFSIYTFSDKEIVKL